MNDKIMKGLKSISNAITDIALDGKTDEDLRKIQGIKDKVIAIAQAEGANGIVGVQLAMLELHNIAKTKGKG